MSNLLGRVLRSSECTPCAILIVIVPPRNSDKFRLALEAVNGRDAEKMVEHVHPDVEWQVPALFPDAEVYRGHAGMRRWLATIEDVFDDLRIEPVSAFRDLDEEHVLVEVRASGTGRESGVPVDATFYMLGTGRELLERMEFFAAEEDALVAAGHKM
jgi:ketosteroid isomerase-like protein